MDRLTSSATSSQSPTAWAECCVRRFSWMLLAVTILFIATEAVALAGWVDALRPLSFADIVGNILFAIGFGIPLVLYLSSLPGWRETGITLATGMLLAGVLGVLQEFGAGQVITGLGLASLGTLAWRAWRNTGAERLHALVFFLPACVALLSTLEAGIFFNLISSVFPYTHDAVACAIDGAHGLQPSFIVGQWFEAAPVLMWICFAIYVAPPPTLIYVYALQVRARRPPPIDSVTVLLVSVIIGYGLYFVYPVAGPLAAFPESFAKHPPAQDTLPDARMAVPFTLRNGEEAPRNGMPSLHFASVLLAYWHARPYGIMARGIAAVFLAGTFLATLGLGEHFFVDLVVALPFTLLMQAGCTPGLPELRREKWAALFGAGVLLAAWYYLLFAGIEILRDSVVLTWAITLSTASLVWWLERRLYHAAYPPIPERDIAPGPRGTLVFGNLAEFRRDVLKLLVDSQRDHGDVVRFRLGPSIIHLVAHPEHIKHVLVTNQHNYNKDTRSSSKIRGMTGEGLLTSNGDSWLRQRRLMQPAFHPQRLAAFAGLMTDATSAMLRRWRETPPGQPLDIASEMMRLTYTIVGKALFGADVTEGLDIIEPAATFVMEHTYRRLEKIVDLPLWVPTPANRRFRRALRAIDDVVFRIMQEQGNSQASDLLSVLRQGRDVETGDGMSAQQLRNETITLLLAGHETTANALTWTWYLLSQHPWAAERVRAEAAEVLGGRPPTFADLPRLKYTTMVFQEAMRLYPPIWVMERRVLADDRIAGFDFPAGTTVIISPYVTHRHPALWERPDEFDPERFTPQRMAARMQLAYLPFGAGQRLCIGRDLAMMEAQIIVPMVLQACRLELVPGAVIEPKPGITLRSRHGLPMAVKALASFVP